MNTLHVFGAFDALAVNSRSAQADLTAYLALNEPTPYNGNATEHFAVGKKNRKTALDSTWRKGLNEAPYSQSRQLEERRFKIKKRVGSDLGG